MYDFKEITERIKDIISGEVDGKVTDSNVAKVLGFTQTGFASRKLRNSLPYEEIILFCVERNISINWLLFNQGVKEIV